MYSVNHQPSLITNQEPSQYFMLFEKLEDSGMMFKFPSMNMPAMHFPKMHFPKFSAKDFAGGQASMSTTEFHCVNGTCDGKTVKGSWKTPMRQVGGK